MPQYVGSYGAQEMTKWAGWAERWRAAGRKVWFAFNNTDSGMPPAAITDCRALAAALRGRGVYTD